MQTKAQSLTEALTNVLTGYIVAIISQMVLFPLVGIECAFTTNLKLGLYFTLISLVRSYVIRRYFNKGLDKQL